MACKGICSRSRSSSCCCSGSGSGGHCKRGVAEIFCKVKEVEAVEINVQLSNVKLNGHIKSIVFVGFTLDSLTSVVEVVIPVELLALVVKSIMQEGKLELFESSLDTRDFCWVSVGCFVADVGDNLVHDEFVEIGFEDNRVDSIVDKVSANGKLNPKTPIQRL